MSDKKIESSKIPTSLFLLSSVLLTATSRSSLEHKREGKRVAPEVVAQLGEGAGEEGAGRARQRATCC